MADRGAFRFIRAQWWSYTFPCFHAITIFSRDLTSDWLRSQLPLHFHLAALLCAFTPQYVHTRSIQLCAPSISLFLFFWPHFFNMSRIQLWCQPDFRRNYVLHCLFDIICWCIYSSDASTIAYAIISIHSNSISRTWVKWCDINIKIRWLICREFCICAYILHLDTHIVYRHYQLLCIELRN